MSETAIGGNAGAPLRGIIRRRAETGTVLATPARVPPRRPMRARLLAAFFLLDGLCALALPAVGALLSAEAVSAKPVYVEVAGTCVEARPSDEPGVMGVPVPMALCD